MPSSIFRWVEGVAFICHTRGFPLFWGCSSPTFPLHTSYRPDLCRQMDSEADEGIIDFLSFPRGGHRGNGVPLVYFMD